MASISAPGSARAPRSGVSPQALSRGRVVLIPGGAWKAAGVLFASLLLRGERQPPGPAYRRSSCCLIYRVVPGGHTAVCGDCALNGRTARRTRGTRGAPRPGQEPS